VVKISLEFIAFYVLWTIWTLCYQASEGRVAII